MSNIPQARELLHTVLTVGALNPGDRATIRRALSMMTRTPPMKRVPGERVVITAAMRKRIFRLARDGYSNHEIAELVGLRNAGRVTEVLQGKR